MFILNSETLIHQSYLLQPFPPVTVVSVSYYYHLPPFRKNKSLGEIWNKTSCSSLSVSFLPLDSHRNQPYILLLGGISPSLITQLLFFLEGMGAMNQSWIPFLQNSTQLIVQQGYRSNSNHRGNGLENGNPRCDFTLLGLLSSNAGAAVTKALAFGDVMNSKGLVWTNFHVTLTPPNYGITFTTPLPRGIFH